MAEYKPYTKEERERLVASMERWNMLGQDRVIEVFAGAVVIEVRRYEATVAALEAEVTEDKDNYQTMLDTACQEVKKRQELEAELARLRPLAEVGEAVEGMELGDGLFREGEHEWRVRSDLEYETSNWEIVDNAPTPLAAFEAMKQKRAKYEAAVARADDAALRAAKGEADAHYP